MGHRFPLKEIAMQAGVSLATVDRAMHGRGQVRLSTLKRIEAAIGELERQQAEAAVSGRRFLIDLVMEAPDRFSSEVRRALEAELPALRPAQVRCRFHLAETFAAGGIETILQRIGKRGSHGVVVKAADTPKVRYCVMDLMQAGIPVVTFVTDLVGLDGIPYVGMDNRQAGATAAWCLAAAGGDKVRMVLATASSSGFRGESERLSAFGETLAGLIPGVEIRTLSEGYGSNRSTGALVRGMLEDHVDINAVYSAGGGNRAILREMSNAGRTCVAYVAHDLDWENRALLDDGKIDVVLHHDLRRDARSAVQLLLRHHRMLPRELNVPPSNVEIVTRFNLPGQT